MPNNDRAYIQDMTDTIQLLESFFHTISKDGFLTDIEKQFAAARALEIIGEASAKLSEEFRNIHPEIDWRGLKSMRNLLIHEYAYVDAEEVWKAYTSDIPDLKEKLQKLSQ